MASFLNSPPANLGRVILMAFTILLFLWGSGLFTVARKAGFNVERLELVPTDMTHPGKEGLAGWIRTTWMPLHSTCLRANETTSSLTL